MNKDYRTRTAGLLCIRIVGLTLVSLALPTLVGCSPPTSTIQGKVTFEGEPITTGTIAFVAQNGKVATGNIEFGEYEVTGVEIGPGAKVAIMSHQPSPMMQPPTGPIRQVKQQDPLKFVPIPGRYADHKESGLTIDVVEGEQTRDFQLEP